MRGTDLFHKLRPLIFQSSLISPPPTWYGVSDTIAIELPTSKKSSVAAFLIGLRHEYVESELIKESIFYPLIQYLNLETNFWLIKHLLEGNSRKNNGQLLNYTWQCLDLISKLVNRISSVSEPYAILDSKIALQNVDMESAKWEKSWKKKAPLDQLKIYEFLNDVYLKHGSEALREIVHRLLNPRINIEDLEPFSGQIYQLLDKSLKAFDSQLKNLLNEFSNSPKPRKVITIEVQTGLPDIKAYCRLDDYNWYLEQKIQINELTYKYGDYLLQCSENYLNRIKRNCKRKVNSRDVEFVEFTHCLCKMSHWLCLVFPEFFLTTHVDALSLWVKFFRDLCSQVELASVGLNLDNYEFLTEGLIKEAPPAWPPEFYVFRQNNNIKAIRARQARRPADYEYGRSLVIAQCITSLKYKIFTGEITCPFFDNGNCLIDSEVLDGNSVKHATRCEWLRPKWLRKLAALSSRFSSPNI